MRRNSINNNNYAAELDGKWTCYRGWNKIKSTTSKQQWMQQKVGLYQNTLSEQQYTKRKSKEILISQYNTHDV
jgi:hypothetical protein